MKQLLLLPALALGLSACAGSTPPLAAPTINVSGTWVATLAPGATFPQQVFRFTLTQRGHVLSGQAEIVPDPAGAAPPYTYDAFGQVSGIVSGDRFNFTARGTGDYAGSITLSGTVVGNKLTGTWVGFGGQGWSDTGSFSAIPQD
ncbi:MULTISPECIES: hypothetical protein [Deinococcus]|uniref:hypothetical protein n=1 Tax=Deinococcus TaxID=1298 RepID=UPI0018E05627|nr:MULTISPECIES: hypothetical protein [Deinococcus]MBI0446113.1 hypothetical protein [Deinococcus sp. DB0503]